MIQLLLFSSFPRTWAPEAWLLSGYMSSLTKTCVWTGVSAPCSSPFDRQQHFLIQYWLCPWDKMVMVGVNRSHPIGPWLSGILLAPGYQSWFQLYLAKGKRPFCWSQLHGLHIPARFHYGTFYSTDKADLANIKWGDASVSMAWSPSVSLPPWRREKAEGLSSLSLLMMFLWQVWMIRRHLSKKDQQWLLHHQRSPLDPWPRSHITEWASWRVSWLLSMDGITFTNESMNCPSGKLVWWLWC